MDHEGSPVFSSSEMRTLLECPVCVQTYRNPKALPCGHSVCADCCRSLNQQRVNLMCPVCRNVCSVPAENLPINFGLRDLVQHHVEAVKSDSATKTNQFVCVRCEKSLSGDDCWFCSTCRAIVCCSCALRHHQTHNLQEMKSLIVEKEADLSAWRTTVDGLKSDVVGLRQQMDQNRARISRNNQSNYFALQTRVMPYMQNASKSVDEKLSRLLVRVSEVNAARLIADDIAGKETDFKTIPSQYDQLKEEAKAVLEKQKRVLALCGQLNEELADYGYNGSYGATSAAEIDRVETASRMRSTAVIPRVSVAFNLAGASSPGAATAAASGQQQQHVARSTGNFLQQQIISFSDSDDEDVRQVIVDRNERRPNAPSTASIHVPIMTVPVVPRIVMTSSGIARAGHRATDDENGANRLTSLRSSTSNAHRTSSGHSSAVVRRPTPRHGCASMSTGYPSRATRSFRRRHTSDEEDADSAEDMETDIVASSSVRRPSASSSRQQTEAPVRSVAYKRRAETIDDSSDSDSTDGQQPITNEVDCAIRFRSLSAAKK